MHMEKGYKKLGTEAKLLPTATPNENLKQVLEPGQKNKYNYVILEPGQKPMQLIPFFGAKTKKPLPVVAFGEPGQKNITI